MTRGMTSVLTVFVGTKARVTISQWMKGEAINAAAMMDTETLMAE